MSNDEISAENIPNNIPKPPASDSLSQEIGNLKERIIRSVSHATMFNSDVDRLLAIVRSLQIENTGLNDEVRETGDYVICLKGELNELRMVNHEQGEKAWGCGHTNQGSCSQCLGRVTNERNDLLIKNKVLQVSLAEQGDEIRELKESIAIYEKALKTQ